ncbi:MAG: TIGR01777 family oxidoreductase, partial [Chloroflexota bacterium]|nr:TIGR01777 family oxidoreductase [Chloroflexota bacterium]
GNIIGRAIVKNLLHKIFVYRHNMLSADLLSHARYQSTYASKILISGSTGMIGQALSAYLSTGGHKVVKLVRGNNTNEDDKDKIFWDPVNEVINLKELEGFDYVIHLAGENVGESRWTTKKKAKILDSRVHGTAFLAESLSKLKLPPKALLCASATGYYGDAGDSLLNEQSPNGTGFLAQVVEKWEESTRSAADKGIRVVNLRFGVVISPIGGALKKLLLPFKIGFGGKIGNGRQYMSWISLDDAIGAIRHLMENPKVEGPINIASNNSITNKEFTKQLGAILKRPTLATVPALVIKILFGKMGKETVLASTRVDSSRLLQSGYTYRHPHIEGVLNDYLGKITNHEI